MTTSKASEYITSLNALRGIAALAVVYYHTQDVMHWSLTTIFSRGYLAVDLFFILSGFVLMHVYHTKFKQVTKHNYWQFITNRFARIYPVHVAMLTFLILMEPIRYILNHFGHISLHEPIFSGQTSIHAIVTNLLLIQAWHVHHHLTWNGPSWSISSEWFAYLCAPFLIGIFAKWRSPFKAIVAFMIADAALWCLSLSKPSGLDSTFNYGNLRMLFEFCMGLSVYNLYHWFKQSTFSARFSGDQFALLLITGLLGALSFGFSDFSIVQLYALLIPLCSLSRKWLSSILSSKPLFHLGEISYSLYMTHSIVVYTVLMKIERYLPLTSGLSSWITLLVVTAASLLLAHLTYTYLEIPSRDRLRDWFKRHFFSSNVIPLSAAQYYSAQAVG